MCIFMDVYAYVWCMFTSIPVLKLLSIEAEVY